MITDLASASCIYTKCPGEMGENEWRKKYCCKLDERREPKAGGINLEHATSDTDFDWDDNRRRFL